jgi:hypothetical protein
MPATIIKAQPVNAQYAAHVKTAASAVVAIEAANGKGSGQLCIAIASMAAQEAFVTTEERTKFWLRAFKDVIAEASAIAERRHVTMGVTHKSTTSMLRKVVERDLDNKFLSEWADGFYGDFRMGDPDADKRRKGPNLREAYDALNPKAPKAPKEVTEDTVAETARKSVEKYNLDMDRVIYLLKNA